MLAVLGFRALGLGEGLGVSSGGTIALGLHVSRESLITTLVTA